MTISAQGQNNTSSKQVDLFHSFFSPFFDFLRARFLTYPLSLTTRDIRCPGKGLTLIYCELRGLSLVFSPFYCCLNGTAGESVSKGGSYHGISTNEEVYLFLSNLTQELRSNRVNSCFGVKSISFRPFLFLFLQFTDDSFKPFSCSRKNRLLFSSCQKSNLRKRQRISQTTFKWPSNPRKKSLSNFNCDTA